VARAIAIGAAIALSLPALADDGYPPSKYDIGGNTEIEVIQNYREAFGPDAAPLISVPYGSAKAECDRINLERWGVRYPEGNDGSFLVGCLIRYSDLSQPIIVYSDGDPNDPDLAVRLLRHEIGHLLGWPGTHERN
jgi:hypothetical protein